MTWVVWTTVTSSERLLAPASILPALKPNGGNYDRHRIVHYWHEHQKANSPHHHRLAEIIDAYLAQTITTVDKQCQLTLSTFAFPWNACASVGRAN